MEQLRAFVFCVFMMFFNFNNFCIISNVVHTMFMTWSQATSNLSDVSEPRADISNRITIIIKTIP